MSGTLIEIPGLEGSLPRISEITSGRVPAFWGAGQNVNAHAFSPPSQWSAPGFLLRRPRVAFVGSAQPSGPLIVATEAATIGSYKPGPPQPIYKMSRDDIPGVLPRDFVFSQRQTGTYLDDGQVLFGVFGLSEQTIPSPMKFPEVASGQPFISSDFLYVLVASTYNAHTSVNVSQLIAQKPRFPRMAVRIFTPVPVVLIGNVGSLAYPYDQEFARTVRINAAWNLTLQSAVAELQAAGIDVQIVGTEADATVEVVGKLIADHFGFTA